MEVDPMYCVQLLYEAVCILLFSEGMNPSVLSPAETGFFSRGVMVKTMDYGIVVSEFKLQSRYYVHFRTNTLGKGMNPHNPAMG